MEVEMCKAALSVVALIAAACIAPSPVFAGQLNITAARIAPILPHVTVAPVAVRHTPTFFRNCVSGVHYKQVALAVR
jgi:hypothetical protein